MKGLYTIGITLIWFAGISFGRTFGPMGTIVGHVMDSDTHDALPGANVTIQGTEMGAATDSEGGYTIPNVPVGSYALQFNYMGYQSVVKTDVIVKSARTTTVNVGLPFAVLKMDSVTIVGGYFSETQEQPSAVHFSYEEIRRSPGSHGDVTRIISMLPSVAPSTDQTNNLVVRGGNPNENGYYVDNIPIPNINHFPIHGSAGGALGILNVEFIQDVNFHSGGFSSAYGDRLSSVMDISLREGSRVPFDGQIDLNWAGFGLVGEGVLPKDKGSWMVSARRSYLDMLVKTIDVGNTIAPRYGDYQGKVVYDVNADHVISLIGVFSDDHNRADQQTAIDNDMIAYMNQDITQNTVGVNWRALWNRNGYSNSSLSYTREVYKEDAYDTGTTELVLKNRNTAQMVNLRNVNHFRLLPRHAVEFGLEAKVLTSDYDNVYNELNNQDGESMLSKQVLSSITGNKIGIFADYLITPCKPVSITLGGRAEYFSINHKMRFAPRFSFAYHLTPLTTINAAAGVYYQNLPLLLIAQDKTFEELADTRSLHVIAGIEHLLREDTRLTFEVYLKDYDSFPMDPNQPHFFIIDEPFYDNIFYTAHRKLVDTGKAYAHGVEVMLQKKLAERFYGLAGACYFRSRYQDYNGQWRDRTFDQWFIAGVEGGYKPNNNWELSLHWIYSGGRPYTPFDLEASRQLNTGILDDARANTERYPDFNWLNIRVDRRFNFNQSNMIIYLSVYNVLNRKNVSSSFWNTVDNEPDTIYQWGALPIFGIEYEF